MTDEKQIEEMALQVKGYLTSRNVSYNYVNNDIERVVFALKELGYIIPENAVVLSKEEYDELLKGRGNIVCSVEVDTKEVLKELEGSINQARKETAREILSDLWKNRNAIGQLMIFEENLIECAKQYGVEVEENDKSE